jgi:hypothetical protein
MHQPARHRHAAILVAALLLAACDSTPPVTPSPAASLSQSPLPAPSTTASPVPPATAEPTPAPTPIPTPTAEPSASPPTSPAAGAWPYRTDAEIVQTVFPADGRVVVVEQTGAEGRTSVVVLDADGRTQDGWPWSPEPGRTFAQVAPGPDDTLYVLFRGEAASALHRLTPAAQEAPGFPVPVPAQTYCALDVAGASVAYVTCELLDEELEATGTTLLAVRPDGSPQFPAPVQFARSATLIGFGDDGAPIVAIQGADRTVIRALSETGATTWSTRAIQGDAIVDPQGQIRITGHRFEEDACAPPIRTTYDLLGADGVRRPGWPFSVAGWASDPAILGDGSMVVVTDDGRALRFTTGAKLAAGWPVRGIDVSFACHDGSTPVAGGTRVVVVGSSRVTAVRPTGRVVPGWPADPPGGNAIDCPGCTPGSGATLAPVVASLATYVAIVDQRERPRVAVIAPDGTVRSRTPIGRQGAEARWLAQAPTGRVWAVSAMAEDEGFSGRLTLIAEDQVPGR